MHLCERCRKPYAELHHIVFKSQNKAVKDWAPNFKYLCGDCHRTGEYAPHNNIEVDRQYKKELQEKIFEEMEDQEYFCENRLLLTLGMTTTMVQMITKVLTRYEEGYKKDDVVRSIMGGRIY